MVIGLCQLRTTGDMPLTRMGARNTVPSSIARMVPLGLSHFCFRLYSLMRCSLGVIVAHFTLTPRRLLASAASIVT